MDSRGSRLAENALLLREGKKIVEAVGRMLAPFCEVVLHDLSKPNESILAIENRKRQRDASRNASVADDLSPRDAPDFAAKCGATPHSISLQNRRELVRPLVSGGYLELRGAPSVLAGLLGVAQSSIYNLMK